MITVMATVFCELLEFRRMESSLRHKDDLLYEDGMVYDFGIIVLIIDRLNEN